MYRFIILLLTLLALAAIGYFCIYKISAPAIQADIQTRTSNTLRANGIDWAEVSVSGRDITLSGVAPSEDMRQSALQLARVKGYNFVENKLSLAGEPSGNNANPADKAFSLKISKLKNGKVILDGVLDEKSKGDLLTIAREQYGASNLTDNVVMIPGSTPGDFTKTLANTLEKMNGLTEAEALITGNNIYLSGQSSSKIMLQQIQQQLLAAIPKSMHSHFNLQIAGAPDAGNDLVNTAGGDSHVANVNAKACQKLLNQALKQRVQFNRGSAVIQKNSYVVLDQVADISKQCDAMAIVVHGHTDASGRNDANRRLSKKRAQAVVNYLASKGIEQSRFKTVGHGSSKPVASNKTERGRARNRRIELSVEVNK